MKPKLIAMFVLIAMLVAGRRGNGGRRPGLGKSAHRSRRKPARKLGGMGARER
jgi:hypothetical protein